MPPSGSKEQSQQQAMASSGFRGSNLYSNPNIWSASITNAIDRSLPARGVLALSDSYVPRSLVSQAYSPPTPDTGDNPTGSSALNANSEADVWRPTWNNRENPSRSTSSSPNRTRDGGMGNASGFFDASRAVPAGYESNVYNATFPPTTRSPQETSYRADSIGGYGSTRDSAIPPSRQSQGSPGFADLYNSGRGHTPSNSIQSQRPMPTHSASFENQAANQFAFNLNRQLDDEMSLQFSRRVTLDTPVSAAGAGSTFTPPRPFQLNPGSQPWVNDNNVSRFNGSVGMGSESMNAQLPPIKRGSIDRVSQASNYRLEQTSSPRTYTPTQDPWNVPVQTRDVRAVEPERRTSSAYPPSFPSPYYASLQYANLAAHYAPSYLDPYAQNLRHHILPGYPVPSLTPNYSLGGSIPVQPARDQDPARGVRSVLLDEFRLNSKSNRRYELKDIYNHVVEFSGDQHGSRFIQQKLETANSDEKEQVFREIEVNAVQLMKDVFGNYVIQKFFEHGNQVQKKVLAEKMKGKVVDCSLQTYACRVVQKALEHILVEQQAELVKELEPEVTRVIKDSNGNHVIQKVIELVPRQHFGFIMDTLKDHVTAFATNGYGCRVVQRMLENGTAEDKARIMEELHSSMGMLIIDQYGNYVAQHVIQNGKEEDREKIVSTVMSTVMTLSRHKFASNVVEKCIEHGLAKHRSEFVRQLTTVGPDGSTILPQLMRDQYANYVVQKLLMHVEGEEKAVLVEEIKPHFYNLKKGGSSRQTQVMETLLGLSTPAKGATNGLQVDVNSPTPTPVLTNESNSPQSSGPPSTNASAVGVPADDDASKTSTTEGTALQVQDNEA
ncbi:hypothetical protein FDECE_8582 [Fusarium decemcellulare]|nr:hypothetical protein FDECE_8582 [Fusarium decemcellulare]